MASHMKQTPSAAKTQAQPKVGAHEAKDMEDTQAETGAAGAGRTKKVLIWAIPLGLVVLLAGA